MISVFNGLVGAVVVSFIIAASLTLLPTPPQSNTSPEHCLAERMFLLRQALYAAGTVLVAATFELGAVYRWPGAFIRHTEAPHLDALANAMVVTFGILYSLFLAAVYLPAVTVLGSRAETLARERVGDSPQRRRWWLRKHDLVASPRAQIASIVAAAGPLLGGPVSALMSILFSD